MGFGDIIMTDAELLHVLKNLLHDLFIKCDGRRCL